MECISLQCEELTERILWACRSLDLLPDGVDPGHLVRLRGSLDVVVGVGFGDNLEQVALDLTFDPCGGGKQHTRFTLIAH